MTGRNGSFSLRAVVTPFGFVVGANILLFAMLVLIVCVIEAAVLNMSFQLLMVSRGLFIFLKLPSSLFFVVVSNVVIPALFVLIDHAIGAIISVVVFIAGILIGVLIFDGWKWFAFFSPGYHCLWISFRRRCSFICYVGFIIHAIVDVDLMVCIMLNLNDIKFLDGGGGRKLMRGGGHSIYRKASSKMRGSE